MIYNSDRRMYLYRYYHLQRMGATEQEAVSGAWVFVFCHSLQLLSASLQRVGLSAHAATGCFRTLAAALRKNAEKEAEQ